MNSSVEVVEGLDSIRTQCQEDVKDDLLEFLRLAQDAAYNTDGSMSASFVTTIAFRKKKTKGGEFTYELAVKKRTHIPKPVITRKIEFDGDQARLL